MPSNLALKQVGSIWVAYLVIAFGAVALGSAFMKTYGQMIVTRVFLGIAEGGTLVSFAWSEASLAALMEIDRRDLFTLLLG